MMRFRSITSAQEPFNHTAALGTPLYMAPEILEHKPYSSKIDIFSFAVVLWVLYTRREPYADLKRQWGESFLKNFPLHRP